MSTAMSTPSHRRPAFREVVESSAAAIAAIGGDEATRRAAATIHMAMRMAYAKAPAKSRVFWDSCSPESIADTIRWCVQHRLEPGTSPAQCYLIPEGGQLQARITAYGQAVLLARAGVDVMTVPIHKEDGLRVYLGEVIEHEPCDKLPASLDDLRGIVVRWRPRSSAGVRTPWTDVWVPLSTIQARRAKSKKPNDGPWKEWPIEMAQGAAIRYACARSIIVTTGTGFTLPEDPDEVAAQREAERVERARGPAADLARARQLAAPVDAWEAAAEPERDPVTGEVLPEEAGAR